MSRLRFLGLAAFALALSVLAARTGKSSEPARGEQTCVIYSLSELGDDPDLGQWVAQTIPEVIEPGSWNRSGDDDSHQALHYYAPKKILVIYQAAAVQAKVEAFLKDLKTSLSEARDRNAVAGRTTDPRRGVTPAEYREPASIPAANAVSEPSLSYPVPAPARPPKHLFHFIIRYEGDGVVDENVVKVMKAQMGAKEDKAPDAATVSATQPSRASWASPSPMPDAAVTPMLNAEDKEESTPPGAAAAAKTTKKDDRN